MEGLRVVKMPPLMEVFSLRGKSVGGVGGGGEGQVASGDGCEKRERKWEGSEVLTSRRMLM